MEIKKFENELIAFDFESDMVNATDMLKLYPNKNMGNFLRNQQTKDFIEYLDILIMRNSIVKSTGRYGGTMMHKLLAYKFAAWLNPEFELAIYQVFDGYLQSKLISQQRELDYFWDKEDQKDLY